MHDTMLYSQLNSTFIRLKAYPAYGSSNSPGTQTSIRRRYLLLCLCMGKVFASPHLAAGGYGAPDCHRWCVFIFHFKALEFNLKAIAILEKVLPAEHSHLAQSYNNLALIYGALGEHQQQLNFNLKSLDIREKVLPAEHLHLAQSYNNLAWNYYALGDLEQACRYMQNAVAIFKKSLPPMHPHVQTAKESLAILEQKRHEQG